MSTASLVLCAFLVRISLTSFPAFTLLFVQNTLVYIIKRKLHGGFKIQISFSHGKKKQYFTHSLRSPVRKILFYHSKIKFVSSRRGVISSMYYTNGYCIRISSNNRLGRLLLLFCATIVLT